MPISAKKHKALLKLQRKRNANPRPTAQVAKPAKMKHRERNRFTVNHPTILFCIETTIVQFWEANPLLDDATTLEALKSAIAMRTPTESTLALRTRFDEAFNEQDVDQDVWIDGLRAIYTSATNVTKGGLSYLSHAKSFVAQASHA